MLASTCLYSLYAWLLTVMHSAVSEATFSQLRTIQFSLSETSRVHDVTMTFVDDVIASNNTIHRIISQVA